MPRVIKCSVLSAQYCLGIVGEIVILARTALELTTRACHRDNVACSTGHRGEVRQVGPEPWLVQPEVLSEDFSPALKDIKGAG